MNKKLILFLIDGLRPDGAKACGSGSLGKLMEMSTYTFCAKTVMPSITLPCHMSLFHSVDPARHGVTTNTYINDELVSSKSEQVEYSINDMQKADYGKHYLDNAKTVADIMPYLLKEMPILRLDDSYLDSKDKSMFDRNKVVNSIIYRNQIAHCFYKRVTKRMGDKPITGQNIINCIMELANYRCKDILASQKVQRKQLAKNKLNKISYMADMQNLFTGVKTKYEWIITASKNNNNLQHYLAKCDKFKYSIHIDINPKKNTFKVSSLFLKRTQNFKDKDSAYKFITCLINLFDLSSMEGQFIWLFCHIFNKQG